MLETLQQLDQQILIFLNGFHSPFWDKFMWVFTGKWTWIPMYATILYVLLKNFNIYISVFTTIAIALTILYADQICASAIRPMVERMRPSNLDNPISDIIHIVNGKRGGRYGFPSCHAANSFALAFFIMLLFKRGWLTLFMLLWATTNSYSRVYLGVHYPGDLIAGLIVGLSGALIVYYLYRFLLRIPVVVDKLKNLEQRELLRRPSSIRHTSRIIQVGLLTIMCIIVYASF